jgi:glycosyltransferase involved in cell wall biosynthesis
VTRPRIAVVVPTLHGAGCERIVASLLWDLVERFDVTLVLYERRVAYPIPDLRIEILATDHSPEHSLAYKAARAATRVARLRRILQQGRFDVVLSFIDNNNVVACVATRLVRPRPRLVVAEHTIGDEFFARNPYARRLRRPLLALLRATYARADRVVVITREMERYFRARLRLARPLDVIPNGVDLSRFAPVGALPEAGSAFMKAGARIVHAGRLDENKDQAYVVRLMPEILALEPEARLFLLGVGPREQDLRALVARMGLQDVVHFLGWRDDIERYLRGADVLVLSSDYESFGNVLVEALACGASVVTTRATAAFDEILDHGRQGAIVDKADPRAFVAAVVHAIARQRADRSIRERNAEYARSRYSIARTRRRYVELLEEVAAS